MNSPDDTTVKDVEIVGNHSLSDSAILEGLATRPPSGWIFRDFVSFDPIALDSDKERIESFYQRQGYLSAKVTSVKAYPAGSGKTSVRITVEEGEPAIIESLEITAVSGLNPAERAQFADKCDLSAGNIFIHQDYLDAKESIRNTLVSYGYAFTMVTGVVKVSQDMTRVSVKITPNLGPLTHFGRTKLYGNSWVPDKAVRNRIVWTEGDLFDPQKLELTSTRLYRLGLFSNIRIAYDSEDHPEKADVTIHLTEGSRNELRFGVGAGVDRVHYEVRGRAAYIRRGFFSPLTTLRLEARPAYMFLPTGTGRGGFGGEGSAGLEQDDFLLPMLRVGTQISYSAEEHEAYALQGLHLNASLDRAFFEDRLRIVMGWRFRFQSFYHISEAIPEDDFSFLGLLSPYRLGYLEQIFTYDLRDDPLSPQKGLFLECRLEEGGSIFGGNFDYVKVTPELRGYLPFGPRITAAARLKFGQVLHGQGTVPITQRYFAGGASSHRGFSQQHLAPFATGENRVTVPIGGETLAEVSIEARVDLFKLWGSWFRMVTFIDGADVTRQIGDLDVFDLHWAVGVGLRLKTLVGPIRFDIGFRLNRMGAGDPDTDESFAFHLSLGEAF